MCGGYCACLEGISMNAGSWFFEVLQAGVALFFLRQLWLYRGGEDDGGSRQMRRAAIGGLLLCVGVPLDDLIRHGPLSTGAKWVVGALGMCVLVLGYRMFMGEKRR